jgi:hypothetical protein
MRLSQPQRHEIAKNGLPEPGGRDRGLSGMSEKIAKLPIPALLVLVLLAAVTIGLLLPGPSHSKPEPRSTLQTVPLKAA